MTDSTRSAESFRGLVLRHRGRTGLTQRELATRAGAGLRSVQDWEAGTAFPSAERLEALIEVFLATDGLTLGRETVEARMLWAAVERDAPRMHTPFDEEWFAQLLATHGVRPAEPASAVRNTIRPRTESSGRLQDWGEAPDTEGFVGRAQELERLRSWVLEERCRLVAVLGMGGIGKTSLAARLAQTVAPDFERVYWRSLRNAPPVNVWLAGAIGFLSDQQLVPPASESEGTTALLQLLRDRRCLLVLDNSETLFEPGQREGRYRAGMDGYGRVLQSIGETSHLSCLLLTSREAPRELALMTGVHALELHGLGAREAQVLLAERQLTGDEQAWLDLVGRYDGNGLALKIVSETVRQVYDGNISMFVADVVASQGAVFGGIRRLLEGQVERLSIVERDALMRLAVEREPVSLTDLAGDLLPRVTRTTVVEAIETLRRRSLVERGDSGTTFTLQSMVLEYVTDRLVETVAEEIGRGRPTVLIEQPLIKAHTKDYVRQTQERLIGAPILQLLNVQHAAAGAEHRLRALLDAWRGRPAAEQGYGPGNVINLLRILRGDLRAMDLSRLEIRQAYLAEVDANDASLVDAHLAETVLAQAFDFPPTVALSRDGALLALGTSTGEVWLWQVADRTPLWVAPAHFGAAWNVVLSADKRLLASAGADGTVRLWEVSTGQLLATLEGHAGAVWRVALSADGKLVASGGADGTVRLWEVSTGQLLATLEGHAGAIWGVGLSAEGKLVASGGADGTVRLWEVSTGQLLATLEGHAGAIWRVALSADGKLVASAGADGTVRLWSTSTGQPRAILQGHTGTVWGMALSIDGQLLVSGGEDGTVRLWNTGTGQPRAILQGHTGTVWDVALSSDGLLMASGGEDGKVRLWEARSQHPLATLQGRTGGFCRVALSADGHLVASGGADGLVRVWDVSTGQPLASLGGHAGAVWIVELSADGRLVASGGADGTVRLWESGSGHPISVLQGHRGTVTGVALSADGHLVASGGADGTVRLWEVSTGRPLAILKDHTGGVWRVALSTDGQLVASGGFDGTISLRPFASRGAQDERGMRGYTEGPLVTLRGHTGAVCGLALSTDGQLLASGGEDGTVRLWDVATGQSIAILRGHEGTVWGVALSADSHLVASGATDGTVWLWELAPSGEWRPTSTLQGHTGVVFGVAVSADGHLVASGGFDGTVRLWEAGTGTWLRTVQAERRYERLDITGLKGVTEVQRAALLALGAIEEDAH